MPRSRRIHHHHQHYRRRRHRRIEKKPEVVSRPSRREEQQQQNAAKEEKKKTIHTYTHSGFSSSWRILGPPAAVTRQRLLSADWCISRISCSSIVARVRAVMGPGLGPKWVPHGHRPPLITINNNRRSLKVFSSGLITKYSRDNVKRRGVV